MVVLKRAMCIGKGATFTVKKNLVSNNPATQPFLSMLPDDGELPTMKQLEQKASVHTLESLTKLAEQCEDAHCQPLEVFTRSKQCYARRKLVGSVRLLVKGRQPDAILPPSMCQKPEHAQEKPGFMQKVENLVVTCMKFMILRSKESTAALDLHHMLPGNL